MQQKVLVCLYGDCSLWTVPCPAEWKGSGCFPDHTHPSSPTAPSLQRPPNTDRYIHFISYVFSLKQHLDHTDRESYHNKFLLFLVYLFTFARRENLLDQSLYCVVVNCVCVDVTTELMEVPPLHIKIQASN